MKQDTPVDVAGMLTEVGIDADTADPAVSVGDSSIQRSDRSMEMVSPYSPMSEEISLDTKIGEGELTEVYLGTQKSMRRKVAVRKVNPHRQTENAPGYVLSEAWMLGAFEHPNILPVYLVAKDDEGLPLVVMKAIETVDWSEVLDSPGHRLGCPKHSDPLVFNVTRMVMVCEALEHAHFRGVIHRDVKPENVLIGRDGTVYLHGWELAVALDDDPAGRFPRAADQTQVAGTPAYMAPELARSDAAALGPATDVYLVGATLHEVITGEPRHTGENVFDAFYSAVASAPFDYDPAKVPAELAQILNTAMAAEPAKRFATITDLRHALEAFLRHRPAHRITANAVTAHREFSRSIQAGAEDFIIRELFATAYTAYGTARTFWSRDPTANDGFEQIMREMIEYETDHGSPARALDLLGRLSEPDPELQQRIETSEEFPTIPYPGSTADIDTRARTQPMIGGPTPGRSETDEQRRGRRIFMVTMVMTWTMFGLAFAFVERFFDIVITNATLGVTALLGWVALAVIAFVLSRSVFTAAAAKNVFGPIGAIIAGSAALLITAGTTATPHELVVGHLLVFFVAMAMLNSWFDWRLVGSSAAYLIAFVVGSFWPQGAFVLLGLSNLIALSLAGYIIDERLSEGAA